MRMPKFNSLEEVKEYISSTDRKNIGAITFVDREGHSKQIPIEEFINEVGLDKAAEFIYESSEHMIGIEATGAEIQAIIEKALKDPQSLTEEEKLLLALTVGRESGKSGLVTTAHEITSIIMKAFLEVGKENNFTATYNGFLGVLLILLEETLMTSSDLSVHEDNPNTYHEIINSIKDQIVIPEGIDEACLLLTLYHIIGERFAKSDFCRNMKVNYHGTAQRLGLDMEFLFDEEEKSINHESIIQEAFAPDVKNFMETHAVKPLKEEALKEALSDSKGTVVKPDIRKTLKEDKK